MHLVCSKLAKNSEIKSVLNTFESFSRPYLKQEDIDTIAELSAILTDADLIRITDLADALVALNLKRKTIQFYFPNDHWDDDHDHNNSRDTYVFVERLIRYLRILLE